MAARLVSAAEVRSFFVANPDKVPAEGVKSLNGRGRLHPSLVEAYNKAKRGKVKYGEGVRSTKTVRVGKKSVPLSELRKFAAGKRGRIPAYAIDAYRDSLV